MSHLIRTVQVVNMVAQQKNTAQKQSGADSDRHTTTETKNDKCKYHNYDCALYEFAHCIL